jgi:hypothetical protein
VAVGCSAHAPDPAEISAVRQLTADEARAVLAARASA